MRRFVVAVFFLGLGPTASLAQEWTLGIGTSDFGDRGSDSLAVNLENRHTAFLQKRILSLALGTGFDATAEGDVFVGGGLWARWAWDSGWFIDCSIMPGFYDAGAPGNDLGSALELRSLVGLGYRFANGGAMSAALTHKSNAGLATDNPGENVYLLRYHFQF